MCEVVRLPKSGEPTTALRSAVTILRTPSLRPRRASVTADVLPLLVHFDSAAWQIAKVCVHVIGKRFASLANDSRNRLIIDLKHAHDRANWCSFTERRKD